MELAVHGGNQDYIEDLERVVVGCGVPPARGEEVEAVDALFACGKITSEGDGLSSSEYEKDSQKGKGKKESGEHCVY
jgi:hypothetical protein